MGEVLARWLRIGLPGPVIGLFLLLLLLNVESVRAPVAAAAEALLAHLSLLFVPVGVGVMAHLGLLSDYGWRLALVLVLSTWIGLAVSGLLLRRLWRGGGVAPTEGAP
jgi:holin-like protein